MTDPVEKIIAFWFGDILTKPETRDAQAGKWWQKEAAWDARIRQEFGGLLEQIVQDAEVAWAETPDGYLAKIILLDQFSRNIYRDSPQAFAQDPKALALAETVVAKQLDQALPLMYRPFCYMPFEHAESDAAQRQSLSLFQALCDSADTDNQDYFDGFYQFAKAHADIIARFGRYPHRNAVLGRPSTAAEVAFLKTPGSSF